MRRVSRHRRRQPEGPRTLVGQYLLAGLVDDGDRMGYLIPYLNAGHPGWSVDEAEFMRAAGELAARRFFGADYDVRAVTALASEMRAVPGGTDAKRPGQLELEAVIRAALGETDVDVSGISPYMAYQAHGQMVFFAYLKQQWADAESEELVLDAERISSARGWEPPLADEVLPR